MAKAVRRIRASTMSLSLVLLATTALDARADEIAFKDQRDKAITLPHPAQRVVVIPKPIASMFIAVDGGTQHLSGMHPAAQAVIMKSVLGTIFPEVAKIDTNVVREGFIPNVEEMLKVNPDVVIQWALKVEDYIEPLERVGPDRRRPELWHQRDRARAHLDHRQDRQSGATGPVVPGLAGRDPKGDRRQAIDRPCREASPDAVLGPVSQRRARRVRPQ